jgi:hypothetical protein
MRRRALILLAVLLLLISSGCRAAPVNTDQSLVGTWKDSYGLTQYRFDSDGAMRLEALKLGSFKGTYEVSGNQVTIRYRVMVKDVKDTYPYRIDGNTLYLGKNKFTREK